MLRRLAVALLVLAAAAPTWASDVSLAPSEALRCMTPPEAERGAIPYPTAALERKEGGLVGVELTFDGASSSPSVKIAGQPNESLAQAVRNHVRSYRVPCLQPGQRVVIRQDFRFDPTDGRKVLWTNARDTADAGRARQLACLKWPSGAPAYPAAALRYERQGVVVLRLRFEEADKPPSISVLDETPARALIEAASGLAASTRMPCLTQGPVEVLVDYRFQIEGGERIVLRDMPLVTYLGAIKGIRSAQVYFDFNEMKCPFDLRVELRQPTGNNRIGEVGESVPERAFFLDWLSRQRLDLKPEEQNRLIGDSATVSVPCVKLSLGTKQGGGASQ